MAREGANLTAPTVERALVGRREGCHVERKGDVSPEEV